MTINYRRFVRTVFKELRAARSGFVKSSLPFPYPKDDDPFALDGLGPRLCAYLSYRLEFTRGQSGEMVKAATLRRWKTTTIDIKMKDLRLNKKMNLEQLRETMGGRRLDFERGIYPMVSNHVSFLIKAAIIRLRQALIGVLKIMRIHAGAHGVSAALS